MKLVIKMQKSLEKVWKLNSTLTQSILERMKLVMKGRKKEVNTFLKEVYVDFVKALTYPIAELLQKNIFSYHPSKPWSPVGNIY